MPQGRESRDARRTASAGAIDEAKRIPTKKQVVAGFVVYRKTTDGIKFLLLYRRGNYWNFPKGHFEPGERSIDTALRELEEETGIKKSELRIAPNFRAYERFYFKIGNQGIHDTVILFLAETHKAEITVRPREHSGYGWFLYHDAMNVIGKKYVDAKKVLKQANDFLRPRRKPQASPAHERPAPPQAKRPASREAGGRNR
jgi:8-oxo-dGTP pyrophosphatase MutT (NUDIX family)